MEDVHGNRGKCAQPCRLPYELLRKNEDPASSKSSESIDKGHLLSPKDLCSLDLLPTLVNLGITCFKIEGRLKNPEYVSTVTRIYRKYIDLAQSDKPYVIEENDKKDLLQVFNRGGFSSGYLESTPNSNLIYKQKPNNMGIYIGNVYNYNANKGYITLKLLDDLSIGDTVSLEHEKGTYTISELMINNSNVPSAHKDDIVKIGRIKGNISNNDKIFKMSSKQLNNIANEYITQEKNKQKINCKIIVHKNEPVSMQIYTTHNSNSANGYDNSNIYDNIDFTLTSDLTPVDSINAPITAQRIIDQINKLGGTPFEFEKMDVDLEDNLYIPSISKLNQLRRSCIAKLEEIVIDKIHRTCDIKNISCADNISNNLSNAKQLNKEKSIEIKPLHETKTLKEISALLNIINIDEDYTKLKIINKIYIPLKYFCLPKYSTKIAELCNISNVYIYMPSVMKDKVVNYIKQELNNILSNYQIKGFVISNLSHINILQNHLKNYEIISNYTMNIYNNYSIEELKKLGISCVTLSPELDKNTLNAFESSIKTEVIVYGNLPVMTTNYCLLSKSNSCLEKCSSNCDNLNKKYYLKDRLNMEFRILPDSFTKTTTIFNSKKTNISVNEINCDFIRFNFIDETAHEICNIIKNKIEA